jgi:propionyl-CoA synthetase
VPGYDVRVLDEANRSAGEGRIGHLVICLPLPPGCLPTLWNDDSGYVRSYLSRYPGFYLTGDAGYLDEDDYLYVMSRTDDIINVAGHRLSTGGMEEVLARHADVAECAVIGALDALKGEVPVGLVVLKAGVQRPREVIERELVQMVREDIGAVASFKIAVVVARLPKTRSGKILRGTIKKIADGDVHVPAPATIDDPSILEELRTQLTRAGCGRAPSAARSTPPRKPAAEAAACAGQC